MPYIASKQRTEIDNCIDVLAAKINGMVKSNTDFAGILNYTCTRLALAIIPEDRYWVFALVAGVFNTLNLEFYRRLTAPYEDWAIQNNGDLPGFRREDGE